MKKSLFTQTFSYLLFSMLLVVALLSTIFFLSIRRSVTVWNVNRGQRLESLLLPLITESYRKQGELEEVGIHHALSPFLTSNVFAYVFGPDREPVYIYYNGGRIPHYRQDALDEALSRLSDRSRPMTAVVGSGEIIGYLAADTLGFSNDVANRRFLQTVFGFLAWGATLSILIALVSSFIFSRILAGQAKMVASGLQLLAGGERKVRFPPPQAEEMRDIAESARKLQNQLQEEEKLRRQWAEDIAHDLRTPVSALKVQLEGLADGFLDASPQRLTSLCRELGRIESLVNDLRELNRVESPELRLQIETIHLPHFLVQFKTLLPLNSVPEQQLKISCAIETCRGDRNYLSRAIGNGIQNALVHGEKGDDISLDVAREGDFIRFDISNRGWIDPEETERCFHRLYRSSSSRNEPGSGLGLPIVRAIMRAHGGEARLMQEGNYTHLLLTLPFQW
jgi:two-component system, OmpR family, sensor histidine kinase BaeS